MDKEVEKFSILSNEWWKKDGAFSALHKINKIRAKYIIDIIAAHGLGSGAKILDVGCGGGILAEEIAKIGFDITAVDPSQKSISEAIKHSQFENINYVCSDVEVIKDSFDVVLVMEVLEHVEDFDSFLISCINLLNRGGILFFSTINRTIKSFVLAIIAAEYVMRMVPRKTHDWNKFIKPSEILKAINQKNMLLGGMKGFTYSVLYDSWSITEDVSVNYIGFSKFLL